MNFPLFKILLTSTIEFAILFNMALPFSNGLGPPKKPEIAAATATTPKIIISGTNVAYKRTTPFAH